MILRTRTLQRSSIVAVGLLLTIHSAPLEAQQPPVLDQYRVPVLKLTGVERGNPDAFARPASIEYVAGQLVVIDRRSEMMVHVLDAKSGKTLRRFGRKGGGPGEYEGPWAIVPDRKSRTFWILDTSLRRMTRIDPDQDFRSGRYVPGRSIQLTSNAELNSLQWVAGGTLLATGFVQDGLFASFDSAGRQLPSRGEFRFGQPQIPVIVRQQAYPNRIDTDNTGTRVALATRYSDRLEFYESTGQLIRVAERPFGFEPVFIVTGRGVEQNIASLPDSRNGYVSLHASNSGVYALFSGRRFGDFRGEASFARHVHVFSWTGKLRAVLELDADVLDIAIDPAEQWLYATRHEPVPQIVAYRIPAALSTRR